MGATKHDCEVASQVAHIDEEFIVRLRTFDNWTGGIDKVKLARAGFTYTGSGDKVTCPSCGLKLLNWTSTDDPLHEHAKRRQLCSFIISTYQQLRQNKPPKHPQYQELQARLDSFVGWPGRYVPKTPEELSAAGFFYIGSADRVTCFQCGITLRDWEEEHDPVVEHRRYSELCQFINNTDLNQLGVNTRNTNDTPGQTAGASASIERIPIAEQTTGNTNEEQHGSNTSEGENKTERQQISGICCGVDTQISEIVGQSSLNTEKQTNTKNQTEENAENPCIKDTKPEESIETRTSTSASMPHTGQSQVSKLLAEENQRLKARRTCKVCKKATVSILFLPCGHLATCSDCAPEVVDCVTCGKTILGTVRTYLT